MAKKMLVVDDEMDILELYKVYFEDTGWEVFSAKTGKSGIEISLKENPDFVFLDWELPDLSGEEILKRLKQSLPEIKVIVQTGSVERGFKEKVTVQPPFSNRGKLAMIKSRCQQFLSLLLKALRISQS